MSPQSTNAELDAQVLRIDAQQGQRTLQAVQDFLGRFVSYPCEHARVAHTLWILHTHMMEKWDSTPRLAFLSAEPASGKTRALEVTELLVPNPVAVVNVSVAYLFRKVGSEEGATILFDEIDTIFGPKAKDNEDIRGLLNAGHRRGATTGRCVNRGSTVLTVEIPAYAAVAVAGLGWLPDTLLTRSVIIRMRRRHQNERVEPFRARLHEPQGRALRDTVAAWAESARASIRWPDLPSEITDRDADVWEPLIAIADAVGGGWPERARAAAVALVAASKEAELSLGIRLLADLKIVFGSQDELSTQAILESLHRLEEAPWADMRGKPLDARGLAHRLRQYQVAPKTLRIGTTTPKGYARADLVDAWSRYLPASAAGCTSATSATSETGGVLAESIVLERNVVTRSVADVADVADGEPTCAHCRRGGGSFCEASVAGSSVMLHVDCKHHYRP